MENNSQLALYSMEDYECLVRVASLVGAPAFGRAVDEIYICGDNEVRRKILDAYTDMFKLALRCRDMDSATDLLNWFKKMDLEGLARKIMADVQNEWTMEKKGA